MEEYQGLLFEEFKENDIELLIPIMKRAFDEDTKRHLNEETGGSEGYDNGDFLRKYALHRDSYAYKILKGKRPIGAIILWINANNVNY